MGVVFFRVFKGHDPTRGSDREVVENYRVESGRVGSGQIRRFQNLTDRVGPP